MMNLNVSSKKHSALFFFLIWMSLFPSIAICQSNSNNDNKYLSSNEYELFKNIALEKANYFFYLLNRIGDKQTPRDSISFYINEADLLFHDSAMMEVKLSSGKASRRAILMYLKRISQLNYSELKIEVFSAFFVSNLQYVATKMKGKIKITEYEGVIAFEQYFEGKKGDEIKYKDTTLKAMRVHVLVSESDIGKSWDVMLGDIFVLAVS